LSNGSYSEILPENFLRSPDIIVDQITPRRVKYLGCRPPYEKIRLLSARKQRDAKGKSYLLFDSFRGR
jgi:hypothetical protein